MAPLSWSLLALAATLPGTNAFMPTLPVPQTMRSGSPLEATTEAVASRSALYSAPTGDRKNLAADTTYIPKGWDRPMYRAPDEVMFEWQELVCCLKFMEDKEVNAALLAPETREMMIGYAEVVMSRGAPVKSYEELTKTMVGRWKLAFTTEDRYRALPPATRVYYDLYEDGRLQYTLKFKDKIWNSLVSQARYQVTNQGRLLFEFGSNCIKVNNLFDTSKSFNIPLPANVGNLGTTFTDVSYIDGTIWIEKLRDPATNSVFYTIFEYQGPCEGQGQAQGSGSPSTPPQRGGEGKGEGTVMMR